MTHATATQRHDGSDIAMRASGSDNRARRVAGWALFGFTTVVAAVTFVLSFHGLDDYGHQVAGLGGLSWLVPLGVDGLTLTAIAATFLLAHAPYRVRLYAWTVFTVANAASVAGNLSHANARHLRWDGAAGAAAWPILLTLASHLAIVTRRHLGRFRDSDTATSEECLCGRSDCPECGGPVPGVHVPPPATGTDGAVAPSVPVAPSDNVAPSPATPAASAARQQRSRVAAKPARDSNDIAKQVARRRVRAGESCAVVAADLEVNKKTVERWTKDIREARQRATATPGADSDDAEERVG